MGIQLGLGSSSTIKAGRKTGIVPFMYAGSWFPRLGDTFSFTCSRALRSTLSTSTKGRTCCHELTLACDDRHMRKGCRSQTAVFCNATLAKISRGLQYGYAREQRGANVYSLSASRVAWVKLGVEGLYAFSNAVGKRIRVRRAESP